MFSTRVKIQLAICGVVAVGGLAVCSVCYGKAQYYQGRIDAGKELMEVVKETIRDIIEEREG